VKAKELQFQTTVSLPIDQVKKRFNEDLFRFLAPWFPKVTIQQYDGQEPGNLVWVRLNFLLFEWSWKSLIREKKETSSMLEFIDVGLEIPPFLSEWTHTHRLESNGNQTIITDHIQWKPGRFWPEILVHFLLWGQFRSRPALYRSWFHRPVVKQDPAE
jgi:ligand-binding SRPBCC domain-containing protein